MKFSKTALLTTGLFALCGALALASGSGVSQIDSGATAIVTLFKVIVGILGIGFFVGILVEFAGHKHLGKMAIEFIGVIVCIILAVNSTTVLSLFGVSASLIR